MGAEHEGWEPNNMEIELWRDETREEKEGGNEAGQLMEWKGNNAMELYREELHKEGGLERGGGSNQIREDAQQLHLTVHHPNLSRMLQRRQALIGTSQEQMQ